MLTPKLLSVVLQLLFKYDLVKYDMAKDEPVRDEHGFCQRVNKGETKQVLLFLKSSL